MTVKDELHFSKLREQWREECKPKRFSSNALDFYTPSYYKIIEFGLAALPFILKELIKENKEPDHWFFALRAITHVNPIPKEHNGDMEKMANDWIQWGYDNKFIVKKVSALDLLKSEIEEKFPKKVRKPRKKNVK